MAEANSPGMWRLDESENALDYLEVAIRHLMEVDRNPWAWKWVVIGLHGALYGFGVCAVAGSDYDRVTYEAKSGDRKLHGFDKILKMCQQSKWMEQFVHSKVLKLTAEQKEAITFLKDTLRNRLQHYIPGLWYVELEGVPAKLAPLFDVIEFLAADCHNVRFRRRANGIKRVRALCEAGRRLISTVTSPTAPDSP